MPWRPAPFFFALVTTKVHSLEEKKGAAARWLVRNSTPAAASLALVFALPAKHAPMTTAPLVTLAGPLTLGPDASATAASSSAPPPPVAIAFPSAFRGGGGAGVSYEAYTRGGTAGELEIVARVVSRRVAGVLCAGGGRLGREERKN